MPWTPRARTAVAAAFVAAVAFAATGRYLKLNGELQTTPEHPAQLAHTTLMQGNLHRSLHYARQWMRQEEGPGYAALFVAERYRDLGLDEAAARQAEMVADNPNDEAVAEQARQLLNRWGRKAP
jgi:hypothetical protein